jgi:hypothetical protein
LIGNHAGGSDRYGFWYDMQPHPTGPSFTTTVCPLNTQLGVFDSNVAHSNGGYGLRVFHGIIPRVNPCDDTSDFVTSVYSNFVGWKNIENGAIFERVGDIRLVNFTVADNLLAGIEVSLSDMAPDGTA